MQCFHDELYFEWDEIARTGALQPVSSGVRIFKLLGARRADARNHTIPLPAVTLLPGTEWTFVAMPHCRVFGWPSFHCREEFVGAVTEYIEGLHSSAGIPSCTLAYRRIAIHP
ncbi:hypothetical protein R3P38DRAFT_3152082 [Favolaschia claudopus]|uniref:Uncharacterized protein n=1 Tax=Favolaschia claudopus TaxID=2862362 RepID=A0AAV9Z0I4_9AGAR